MAVSASLGGGIGSSGSIGGEETDGAADELANGDDAVLAVSGPPKVPKQDVIDTGELDESEEFSVRAKSFELGRSVSGGAQWVERGTGKFKLNQHKIRGSHRVVMRAEGGVRVILNSQVFPQMSVERAQEKAVRLSSVDATTHKSTVFLLRVATVDEADKLVLALEKARALSRAAEAPSAGEAASTAPARPKPEIGDAAVTAAASSPTSAPSSSGSPPPVMTATAQLIERVLGSE